MIRSVLLLLSGDAATSLVLLTRNLLVARLIPVADYGIAATFAIAVAVIEMASQLGLKQQIVQARDGDDPRFQAALQGFQVLRGVLGGLALLALAGPIASFLGVPETAWAFRVLAAVPLLMALAHFDVHRLNRAMRFGPSVATGFVPALAGLLAVWPLAALYGDYRVMLYSIVVRAALTVVTSHLVAERPYRLALERAITARTLRFGWPLLLNGVLLFAVFQGDKLLVGGGLGVEALAIFAMGITLTLTPTLVLARSVQTLFLPRLSPIAPGTPGGDARFDRLSATVMQLGLLGGLVLVALTALLGGPFVRLVLGDKYLALIPLLVPLAVQQAMRVAKAAVGVVALSRERTANAMQANLVRIAVLPLAWLALARGADLLAVALIGLAGEAAGYALSLWLVRRHPGVPLRPMAGPLAAAAAFLAAACLPLSGHPLAGPAALAGMAAALAAAAVTMRDLRGFAARHLVRGKGDR